MNQGRIWTVVQPTVGLPLLIGSVAVTSLIVHYAVLSHTTWMSSFFEGGHKKVAMDTVSPALSAAQTTPGFTVSVAPAAFPIPSARWPAFRPIAIRKYQREVVRASTIRFLTISTP